MSPCARDGVPARNNAILTIGYAARCRLLARRWQFPWQYRQSRARRRRLGSADRFAASRRAAGRRALRLRRHEPVALLPLTDPGDADRSEPATAVPGPRRIPHVPPRRTHNVLAMRSRCAHDVLYAAAPACGRQPWSGVAGGRIAPTTRRAACPARDARLARARMGADGILSPAQV